MKQKTVLVAGATGYLGRYVVQTLKRDGYRVRVLARSEGKLSQSGSAFAPAIDDCVDEIHIGDVTRPDTLRGLAEGVDLVFSSVSLMGQTGRLTWHDVDYRGNLNILHEARQANVTKFVYVSVFNAHKLLDIPIVKAHEDFAADLVQSGLDYAVVRPTGYFSDLGAFFDMARSGRVYLFGDGTPRINPIHGVDLARVCVDAFHSAETDINAGGPDILTQHQIAELAFAALGHPPRITAVPMPLTMAVINIFRLFQRDTADLWRFFAVTATMENIAPACGHHHLADHYRALATA